MDGTLIQLMSVIHRRLFMTQCLITRLTGIICKVNTLSGRLSRVVITNGMYMTKHGKATVIATHPNVSFYHKSNNKLIKLGFVTNLEPKNIVLRGDVGLTVKLTGLVRKKALNKYNYPENVIRNSDVLTAIHRGVELKLTTNNCLFEDRMDYHKKHKLSGVVGGSYLVDDNVYNEYKSAMEKVPPYTQHVTLSEREKGIVKKLNKRSGD